MTIDLDEAKIDRNPFGLWLAWTAATTLGMMLGYLPTALLINDVDYGLARIIFPLFAGILMGLAQWLVLRQYVTNGSHNWVLHNAGGWIIGYFLAFLLASALSRVPFGSIISFLLFGLVISIIQWPVLRREIPHLGIWVLANVLGWTLGVFLSQVLMGALVRSIHPSLVLSTLLTVGITGLVAGGITALAFILIVRQPERA